MKLSSEIHRFYCSVHKAGFVWQSNRSAARFEKGFVSRQFICVRGLCRRQVAAFLIGIDNEYEFCHMALKFTEVTLCKLCEIVMGKIHQILLHKNVKWQ
jgi:hypothetical protein